MFTFQQLVKHVLGKKQQECIPVGCNTDCCSVVSHYMSVPGRCMMSLLVWSHSQDITHIFPDVCGFLQKSVGKRADTLCLSGNDV